MAFEINFLGDNLAIVHGVTDDSANTALSTLPPNPCEDQQVFALAVGEGVYVEDAGTAAPRQSGVVAATIDVRSTVASAYFVCLAFKLASGEGHVRDHSSVTT